jgi:hypothetical protein
MKERQLTPEEVERLERAIDTVPAYACPKHKERSELWQRQVQAIADRQN